MSKPRKDHIREERIRNEAVVDAYGPEEQAMGWYYYLGETVEIRRMAPEDGCSNDMLVLVRWQGRHVAVPLSQLVATDADESTNEAIGDWHYWMAQGYRF